MSAVPGFECDLVVRGGTVATAGGSAQCDVAVTGGRISQLGGSPRGRRELDASGALVLPGGLDMHVHLSEPEPPEPGEPAWVDDFGSGSAAAIAGGVTTIGNMTFPAEGDTLHQSLGRDLTAARALAGVDYVLHPILFSPTPEALAELPELAAAGHTSLKLFMVAGEFEAQADGMIEAVRIAGQHGMLTLIHCEDGALVRFAGEQLRRPAAAASATGPPAGQSRPSAPRWSGRSPSARRRGRRSTSSTCRRSRRCGPPAAAAPAACRCMSRPGRCTCT